MGIEIADGATRRYVSQCALNTPRASRIPLAVNDRGEPLLGGVSHLLQGYNSNVDGKLDSRTTRVRIIAGALGVDIRWDQVLEIAEEIDLAEPVEKVRADVVAALKRLGLLPDDQ